MYLVMNPKDPEVSVRLADEGFAPYVWGNDFSFDVCAYARVDQHKKVEHWPLDTITPYRKCYGIDPDEFASYRGAPDSAIFMAYLDNQPVGHVVVSTNWNGLPMSMNWLSPPVPGAMVWPSHYWTWSGSGA